MPGLSRGSECRPVVKYWALPLKETGPNRVIYSRGEFDAELIGGYPTDCRQSASGWEYAGNLSQTHSGYTCQAWDSQEPNENPFMDAAFPDGNSSDAHNYCRNPDRYNRDDIWCYTTSPGTNSEYCDVPVCECKFLPSGTDYIGKMNKTVSGFPCSHWGNAGQWGNDRFPDGIVRGARNYCRNPDPTNKTGPWCYTTSSPVGWEYCDIKPCNITSTKLNIAGKPGATRSDGYADDWTTNIPPAIDGCLLCSKSSIIASAVVVTLLLLVCVAAILLYLFCWKKKKTTQVSSKRINSKSTIGAEE